HEAPARDSHAGSVGARPGVASLGGGREGARVGGVAAPERDEELLGGDLQAGRVDGADAVRGAVERLQAAEEPALGDGEGVLVALQEPDGDLRHAADPVALEAAGREPLGLPELARLVEPAGAEGRLAVAQKIRAAPD